MLLYHLKNFSNQYRLDRFSHDSGNFLYERNKIPSNLVKLNQKFEKFKAFFIELELPKKNRWLLRYS